MDALRSFLSGRRLAIIGILLAIPFVFFGSSSFGTVFTNYGKVNGLTVSALVWPFLGSWGFTSHMVPDWLQF